MAIQIQWLLTETQEKRVPVNGENLRAFSGSLVSRCGLDFYILKQKNNNKKSSVTINVTLKCINRRDDCRTHQVLLPFCIILVRLGAQLGTCCMLFLHREIQEGHGLKWEPPKGNTMNQQSLTQSKLGGQEKRNGVVGLENVISDMKNLNASKRLLQEWEEQMGFFLSLLGRMRSTCKLWKERSRLTIRGNFLKAKRVNHEKSTSFLDRLWCLHWKGL